MSAEVAMSEREIRDAIQQACDKLELEARTDAKRNGRLLIYPLMIGAGLLVANCGDETVAPDEATYGISVTGTETGTGAGTSSGTGTPTGSGGTGGEGATGGFGGSVGGAGGAGGEAGGAGGG